MVPEVPSTGSARVCPFAQLPSSLQPLLWLRPPKANSTLPAGGTPGAASPGGDRWAPALSPQGSTCGTEGCDLGGGCGEFMPSGYRCPGGEAGFLLAPWFSFQRTGEGRREAWGTSGWACQCWVLPVSPSSACTHTHLSASPEIKKA